MQEETLFCHEPWPDVRLDQLQTLARLERRAESLRAELAALQELLTCIARQAAPDADGSQLRGSETILIADDQVIVRAITQGMLETFGYRVLVTDAATRLESYSTPLHLVLLDVPIWGDRARMSEPERQRGASACPSLALGLGHACTRLRQIDARSVRIVVSTPLPEGPARQQLRLAGADAFLSKPFQPLELARCIRQVLDVSCPASTKQS